MRRIFLTLTAATLICTASGCRLMFDVLWNAAWDSDDASYHFDGDGYKGYTTDSWDRHLEDQQRATYVPPNASERSQWQGYQQGRETAKWVEENRYQ